jgi:hypothetical protein
LSLRVGPLLRDDLLGQRFQSLKSPNKLLSLSFFRDEDAG